MIEILIALISGCVTEFRLIKEMKINMLYEVESTLELCAADYKRSW